MAGMVSRKRGRWNSERGTGGPTAVCLFRLPRSDFRVRSVASLPDQHAPRPALPFARGRDEREPGADGADHHRLAEGALDASHRRIAHRPGHRPAGEGIPVRVAQIGEEAGAVARYDRVARRGYRDRRDRITGRWRRWRGIRYNDVRRAAPALARSRDEREPGADGADHHRLAEGALDASHRRIAHRPRHRPAGEGIPVRVAQIGEDAGAVARYDRV